MFLSGMISFSVGMGFSLRMNHAGWNLRGWNRGDESTGHRQYFINILSMKSPCHAFEFHFSFQIATFERNRLASSLQMGKEKGFLSVAANSLEPPLHSLDGQGAPVMKLQPIADSTDLNRLDNHRFHLSAIHGGSFIDYMAMTRNFPQLNNELPVPRIYHPFVCESSTWSFFYKMMTYSTQFMHCFLLNRLHTDAAKYLGFNIPGQAYYHDRAHSRGHDHLPKSKWPRSNTRRCSSSLSIESIQQHAGGDVRVLRRPNVISRVNLGGGRLWAIC